ncbi:MAG: hypothetical protein IPJ00_11275 [Saprospirales bacterium]|nr:hypothetical protein [Saprospirales bacterium]
MTKGQTFGSCPTHKPNPQLATKRVQSYQRSNKAAERILFCLYLKINFFIMELRFIGQGLDPESDITVGNFIINSLGSADYISFNALLRSSALVV